MASIPLDFVPCSLTAHELMEIFEQNLTLTSFIQVSEFFNHYINVLFVPILTHRSCDIESIAVNIVLKKRQTPSTCISHGITYFINFY